MTTAYTASNAIPMTAVPTTNGVLQQFIANSTNSGASTFAPDGLAAAPIFGQGGQPLEGNEIIANGIVTLESYVGPLLNSGAPCWVLVDCVGGALQVAPAIEPQHAVQFQQLQQILQQVGHGQCRLSVTNGTTLTLKPFNGNNVIVNGITLQLKSLGPTVSNSGLAASTAYYVYLGGTTAAPTLSLSTTGHNTASNGVETQTDNAALTVVGMISTNASGQFVDSVTQRFCLNWFNRRNLSCVAGSNSLIFENEASAVNVAPEQSVTWLTWGDESTFAAANGFISNFGTQGGNTPGDSTLQLYIDDAAVGALITVALTGGYCSMTTNQYSEGLHTSQLFGSNGEDTGVEGTCQIDTMIRG